MKKITLSIALLFLAISTSAQGLKITEIMYNPSGTDTNWEWVEIYNSGSEIVDLSGYVFDDNAATPLSEANINQGMIAPQNTVVLFNGKNITAEQFKEVWGDINAIPVTIWPTLGNGGDTIGLWESFESYDGDQQTQLNTIEGIGYDNDDAGWPNDDGKSSIYLNDITDDNTISTNWLLSSNNNEPVAPAFVSLELHGNSGRDVGSPGFVSTISDSEAPEIICNLDINLPSDTDNCSASFVVELPSASDNSNEELTFEGIRSDEMELTSPFPIGETTITWTATDLSGNTSEPCTQRVVVNDAVIPIITCPDDILEESPDGNPVSLEIGVANTEKICESELTLTGVRSDMEDLESQYPVGETTILWKVVDAFGNSAECVQTISVEFIPSTENSIIAFAIDDQVGETLINLENRTIIITMPFGTNITSLAPEITVSDGASISPATEELVDFSNPVSYMVTAQDGSIQKWTVTVMISDDPNDTTKPSIECPEDIVVPNDEGICGASVEFEVLFEDEQSEVSLELSAESGSFFEVGTTEVLATATDASGNSSTCSFNVTVEDNLNPVILCKDAMVTLDSSGMKTLSVEDLYETLFDNCDIASIAASQLSFSEADLGQNEVEVIATDVNGNSASCTAVVSVLPFEETIFSVASFTLINADTNEDLFVLQEGMQIDINTLPTLHLDIRANTTEDVESVRLSIDGAIESSRTESLLPYALFQDLPIGDYMGNDFILGTYKVTAVPYSEDSLQGEIGSPFTLNFEIIDACQDFQVTLDMVSEISTCEGSEGGITVSTVGGVAPITYSWSHDETIEGATATELMAGDYSVTATDANNCTAQFSFTLKDPELPEVSILPFEPITEDDEPIVLIEGQPIGGIYSGEGVSEGEFDPSVGKGIYTITYTFTDNITGCKNSVTGEIQVLSNQLLGVVSFTLINADTNEDIFELEEGMRIEINSLPTLNLDVRANTTEEVESVKLDISGTITSGRTESLEPYALFQDLPIGDYKGSNFSVGMYQVSGVPFSQDSGRGDVGSSSTVNFELVDSRLSVTEFMLVNAETNEDLFLIEEGMIIDINELPTLRLDIRANTTADVESVRLSLEGALTTSRTESLEPYALFQDLPIGDYKGSVFVLGSYAVMGVPYSEDALGGIQGNALTINFELIDGALSGKSANRMIISPNPANHTAQISFKTPVNAKIITIYDTHGRFIRRYNAKDVKYNGKYNLEVKALQSGNYYIKVQSANGTTNSAQLLIKKE